MGIQKDMVLGLRIHGMGPSPVGGGDGPEGIRNGLRGRSLMFVVYRVEAKPQPLGVDPHETSKRAAVTRRLGHGAGRKF